MITKALSHREFMTTLPAGAGTVLPGKSAFALPSLTPGTSINPYQTVNLCQSVIITTVIGMGTGFSGYNRSSYITRAVKGVAGSLIRNAYDKGDAYY